MEREVRRLLIVPLILGLGCANSERDGPVSRTDESGHSLALTWDTSQLDEDGSPLADLAGYRVYDGREPANYEVVTDVGKTNEIVLDRLAPGTYYVSIVAYDSSGNESQLSPEARFEVP